MRAPGTVLLAVEAPFVRGLLEWELRAAGFQVHKVRSLPRVLVEGASGAVTLIIEANTLSEDPGWRPSIAGCPALELIVVGAADLDAMTRALLRERRGEHLRNPLDLRRAVRTVRRVQRVRRVAPDARGRRRPAS